MYLLAPFLAPLLPSIALQEVTLAAIIAGVLLIEMIHALRWHCWREAFLKFAYANGFAVVAISHLRFENGPDAFWGILLPGLLLGSTPRKWSDRKDIERPQFFRGLITLSVLFAVEAGLLGAGLFSHIVKGCAYIALFVWFAIRARRGWAQESDGPTISSASAIG